VSSLFSTSSLELSLLWWGTFRLLSGLVLSSASPPWSFLPWIRSFTSWLGEPTTLLVCRHQVPRRRPRPQPSRPQPPPLPSQVAPPQAGITQRTHAQTKLYINEDKLVEIYRYICVQGYIFKVRWLEWSCHSFFVIFGNSVQQQFM